MMTGGVKEPTTRWSSGWGHGDLSISILLTPFTLFYFIIYLFLENNCGGFISHGPP